MNWLVTACLQGVQTSWPETPNLCRPCSAKQTGAGTSLAMSVLLSTQLLLLKNRFLGRILYTAPLKRDAAKLDPIVCRA